MRLLERNSAGQLTLTKDFVGDNIPEYAILSHTWGADTDELTFQDLMDGTGQSKPGYKKISLCGDQARRDSLRYFWVDSCCIDKSSSAVLSEAIISMFRWYRNAVKCYVYLADVSRPAFGVDGEFNQLFWESTFRKSKWFTRGWTLQELLAPAFVDFYSKDWEYLGDKQSLQQCIHEITEIPVKALQGGPLSNFSINERFLWAKNRDTTRVEDMTYSLLGIFDVQMSSRYGEGRENALRRLWRKINTPLNSLESGLLRHLPYAVEAPFNSFNRQHEPTCLLDTRVDLLQEIYNWSDGQDDRCIFWLSGLAGTGKSTVARTVARRYFDQKRLVASFFFSRGGGDIGHAGRFFTSLAVQLARNIPQIQQHISDAVIEQGDIANQSLRDQWCQLIFRPLSRLARHFSPFSYLIIVDALDECDNEDHIRTILQLLAEAQLLTTIRLRIFLTSRPEIPIRHGVHRIPQTEHQDFVLHNIPLAVVNHDISLFLKHNLGIAGQEWALGSGWPGEQILSQLVDKSSGLFIWAATACRFINAGEEFAEDRLHEILEGISSSGAPEQHLDQIYLTVLQTSIPTAFREPEKMRLYSRQRQILGSIVTLISPLSAISLGRLIGLSEIQVKQTLGKLQAILDVPRDVAGFLRLHHPSFRDFLLNKDRCKDPNFWVDYKQAHQILASGCLMLMSETLKKDICEMHTPGSLATQVKSNCVKKCLPSEVQYACLYWVQHLQRSGAKLYDNEEIHRFLQDHLLHWLEALSWIGKSLEGILAILFLETLIPADTSPNLHTFIHDAKRFVLYNRSVIEQFPLQLYCSALVFTPEKSIVRRQFEKDIPYWIQTKPRVQANWNAALQTLEGHSSGVTSVAFSPDGKLIVSGSNDNTVRLWDATTGTARQTLEGHSGAVYSVAFSPDGELVVSGSYDNTVRLWDVITGTARQTLEGHSGAVNSVAFSPDGELIVSGSYDNTVRFWYAMTGAARQTLEGHSGAVNSVAFSPESELVVSGSYNDIVRLWDAATGAARQTLESDFSRVNSVAFSPDGKLIVSGSDDNTVGLWDATTGAAWQTLEGHSRVVNSVAFSPDGKLIVSGSDDDTVGLWDAVTGVAWQTLKGHWSLVNSNLIISPGGKLHGLLVANEWIAEEDTNILWLPADYRPTLVAIRRGCVAIGHSSGSISFFEFAQGKKEI